MDKVSKVINTTVFLLTMAVIAWVVFSWIGWIICDLKGTELPAYSFMCLLDQWAIKMMAR